MKRTFKKVLLALAVLFLWGTAVKAQPSTNPADYPVEVLSTDLKTWPSTAPAFAATSGTFDITGGKMTLIGGSYMHATRPQMDASVDTVGIRYIRFGSDATITNGLPTTNTVEFEIADVELVRGGIITLLLSTNSNSRTLDIYSVYGTTGVKLASADCGTSKYLNTVSVTLPDSISGLRKFRIVRSASGPFLYGITIKTNAGAPEINPIDELDIAVAKDATIPANDRTLLVKGAALENDVTLEIQAGGSGKFSLELGDATITKEEAMTGKNVALNVSTADEGTFNDTLVISSVGAETVKVSLKLEVTAADNTAPVAVVYSPANSSTNVQLDAEISVEFDEPVTLENAALITIDNGSSISSAVMLNDTILSITADLVKATTYTITVGAGAVKDLSGNANALSSWSFTTDGTAPTLGEFLPGESANAQDSIEAKNIKLIFNELIKIKSDTSGITLNGSKAKVVVEDSILKVQGIKFAARHELVIDAGAIMDLAGNEYAGTTKEFYTKREEITFPYQPTLNEDFVVPSWIKIGDVTGKLTFGRTGECATYNTADGVFRTSSSAAELVFELAQCGDFSIDLTASGSRKYKVLVDNVEKIAETDIANRECANISFKVNSFDPVVIKIQDISSSVGISFLNLNITAPQAVAPVIVSTTPENNATHVETSAAISVTFDQSVVIANASGVTINGTAAASVVATAEEVSITPAAALVSGTEYTVSIATGAITANGVSSAQYSWKFTTLQEGLIESAIIRENFQDWTSMGDTTDCEGISSEGFTSFQKDLNLYMVSGGTASSNLKNVTVSPNCEAKAAGKGGTVTPGVTKGYVMLAKADITEAGTDGNAGEFVVGPVAYLVTKVDFSVSNTGNNRYTTLHKSTNNGTTWTLVGQYVGGESGSANSAEINESNVMLKFVAGSSASAGDQRSRLHDVKVYAMIDSDESIDIPDPTSVTITGTDTIVIGKTLQLSASVSPDNALQDVIWTAVTTTRISVDQNGLVSTVSGATEGSAIVKVEVNNFSSVSTLKTLVVVKEDDGGDGGETAVDASKQPKVKVYPNPVQDVLHVETGDLGLVEVKIYSMTGKLLKVANSNLVDLSGLASGNYFVQVYVEGNKVPAVVSVVKK